MSRCTLHVWGEALVDCFPDRRVVGGAPLNVARHLGALGLKPCLHSVLGQDDLAQVITDELQRFAVDTRYLGSTKEYPTGQVTVHMDTNHGHRFEIEKNQAYDHIPAFNVNTDDSAQPIIYYGSLAQRSESNFDNLLQSLQSGNAIRFFDINWREGHVDPERIHLLWNQSHIVKVNEDELAMIGGWWAKEHSSGLKNLPEAGQHSRLIECLCAVTSIQSVHVTFGAAGAAVFNAKGICIAVTAATPPSTLVDTVGAGDAYAAIIVAALALKLPLGVALTAAVGFASSICGLRGAAPESLAFYAPLKHQLSSGQHRLSRAVSAPAAAGPQDPAA